MADLQSIRETVTRHGQEHVLRYYDELAEPEQIALLEQLATIDWDRIDELVSQYVTNSPEFTPPGEICPPEIIPNQPTGELAELCAKARKRGEQLIADGKVGAFVVAGGQGTRLGFDGPKGCYEITPVQNKPLFQVFAEQILAAGRRAKVSIPWYVMTSHANDIDTRAFFRRNNFFGLNPKDVFFFVQGMMPVFDRRGKLLLAGKSTVAMSPDGHGGSLLALQKSGALADMAQRGVELISYFQVDNPLVQCIDPLFLGLHDLRGAEMSAKALPKRDPMEKLGNFCVVDGKVTVIEYSDMPEDLARACAPDGRLQFSAGSIAIHIISRTFAERLTADGRCELPLHRADKAVPYLDESGATVKPDEPNAVKLEMFVFDALPLCTQSIIYETSREDEFAPIKNASGDGVLDSPDTSKRIQIERAGRWLEQVDVSVPRNGDGQVDAVIEISQYTAVQPEDLEPMKPIDPIERGSEVVL